MNAKGPAALCGPGGPGGPGGPPPWRGERHSNGSSNAPGSFEGAPPPPGIV